MKVFISWSGDRSHRVALLLRDWLSCVVQAIQPWVSSKDIDRGSLWFSEIGQRLGETTVGIICLTRENKERPWILFEAGALAKGLSSSRVCTLLVDLESSDVRDPLGQFNHTAPTKEGMRSLVETLNLSPGAAVLHPDILERAFETYWPQFESELSLIMRETVDQPEIVRPEADVLGEILELVRSLSGRVSSIEARNSKASKIFLVDGHHEGVKSSGKSYVEKTAVTESEIDRARKILLRAVGDNLFVDANRAKGASE